MLWTSTFFSFNRIVASLMLPTKRKTTWSTCTLWINFSVLWWSVLRYVSRWKGRAIYLVPRDICWRVGPRWREIQNGGGWAISAPDWSKWYCIIMIACVTLTYSFLNRDTIFNLYLYTEEIPLCCEELNGTQCLNTFLTIQVKFQSLKAVLVCINTRDVWFFRWRW